MSASIFELIWRRLASGAVLAVVRDVARSAGVPVWVGYLVSGIVVIGIALLIRRFMRRGVRVRVM